jgi:hypothetical protein
VNLSHSTTGEALQACSSLLALPEVKHLYLSEADNSSNGSNNAIAISNRLARLTQLQSLRLSGDNMDQVRAHFSVLPPNIFQICSSFYGCNCRCWFRWSFAKACQL